MCIKNTLRSSGLVADSNDLVVCVEYNDGANYVVRYLGITSIRELFEMVKAIHIHNPMIKISSIAGKDMLIVSDNYSYYE